MPDHRRNGDHRHVDDLIRLAYTGLDELVNELRWKRDAAYGPTAQDTTGPTTGGTTSDPTGSDAASRHHQRRKLGRGIHDLRWLVDVKLPGMVAQLRSYDDGPITSDLDRDAHIDGGVSAYRGDRKAPPGRPDLIDALAAQHRRLHRGEGYGRA